MAEILVEEVERIPVDDVRGLLSRAERADGVAPLGEQPLRALGRPADDDLVHLVARIDGVVVGYAQLDGRTTLELAVDPGSRRRGVASALLDEVARRAEAVDVWAHGDLAAAVALAAARGMPRTRELLVMRRDLDTDPGGPGVPDSGIEVGTLAEAASEGGGRWPGLDARSELLRVNNAAFAWHPEQGGWTPAQLDERLAVDWVDPAGVFLAVATGSAAGEPAPGGLVPGEPRLAGFHWTKVHPADADGGVEGEVYVVAVDPADHGRGLGALLTATGIRHLRARGCRSVVLYVEGDNAAALRTYERLGFRVSARDVTYVLE